MTEGLPVLLVEDDTFLLRTLGDIVGRRGYRPFTASSGRQALDVAAEARPAIALVDLRLPDMDGMEVIGRLHRISAKGSASKLTTAASPGRPRPPLPVAASPPAVRRRRT